MKRLLGLTGLTCLCVLTACFYLSEALCIAIAAGALALFLISMLIPSVRKEGTLPVAFITVVLSVVLFMGVTYTKVLPVQEKFNEKTCTVVATQKREVYNSERFYIYELDVDTIDGEKVNTGLTLFTYEHIFSEPYDKLEFTSLLTKSTASELSRGLYLRAFMLFDPEVEIIKPSYKPLMYHIMNLRCKLRTALYMELSPDVAAFSSALFLGEKHSLPLEFKSLLRTCGLSHIVVVSGLHLSIITALMTKYYKRLFKNRFVCAGFIILSIIFFALLTGFGFPVIRSAVMLIIFTVGNLIFRRSDSINSIGAAALIILLFNPYAVGDVGMLLSFSATLGIVVWSNRLSENVLAFFEKFTFMSFDLVNKTVSYFVNIAACSICATLWTLPILILVFGGFSLVTVISNLLVVPFMTVVIVCIALCALTHYISFLPLISDLFAFVVRLYYHYLVFVCEALSKLPFAYIETDKPYFYIWLSLTLMLVAVAYLINTKNAYRITVIFSALILVWGSLAYNLRRESVLTLYVPDTGTALSVVIESSEGHAVLCCGGSIWKLYSLSNVVEDIFKSDRNVLVSTSEENSYVFSENLVNEFDYTSVLLYDNSVEKTGESDAKITYYSRNHTVNLWDKACVELIVSEGSVFEYVTAGDTELLILPEDGDCENLSSTYRNPDIIITHGYVENIGLMSCDTLIIPGDDYLALASAEVCAPIASRVITGTDITYDIKLKR
ncbi:MAG: ComEC/Rec2 family competence protein [Ruminococcus sp.]|nr:ComEC/Rec2 family competence protein [Ruminococcus sp.]